MPALDGDSMAFGEHTKKILLLQANNFNLRILL